MMNISKLNKKKLYNFKKNKRGYYSFWVFSFLFLISLFANFIANEKPLLIKYNSEYYFPVFAQYSETTFGGCDGHGHDAAEKDSKSTVCCIEPHLMLHQALLGSFSAALRP